MEVNEGRDQVVRVIIPVLDEERSVGKVIREIPTIVSEIIVVNNGSTDNTASVARESGATVINESRKGYGTACLKGISYINNLNEKTDTVVFIDGDYSDHPSEMTLLLDKINKGADIVIGSRALGEREEGSMTVPQLFGNWLATFLIKVLYQFSYTDLGPFRAITLEKLNEIGMEDLNYGWTVEMQIKALKYKLNIVAVSYTHLTLPTILRV